MIVGFVILGSYAIGGAEKRYANLFMELNKRGLVVKLIINKVIFEKLCVAGVLDYNDRNITVVDYYADKLSESINIKRAKSKNDREKPAKIKKYLSGLKVHWNYLIVYLKIRKWQRRNSINILIGVFQGVFAITPYYYQNKIKTVISYNDPNFNLLENKGIEWFLGYRIGLKKATIVDLLSEEIKSGLLERNLIIDSNRINVSPCTFIDYSKYNPAPIKENIIVFCGRLTKIKNPDLFIEAISFVKNNEKYKFLILGKGEMEYELKQRISELGLDKIVEIYYEPKPGNIFSKSKIFVSLQENNNYPSQSMIEAMACENAVIATDVGETRKIVDNNTGVLIKKKPKELANSITDLINNEAEMYRLGKNSRIFVMKNHNIEKFSEYVNELFETSFES